MGSPLWLVYRDLMKIPTSWWLQRFFCFQPLPVEMIQFDSFFLYGLKPPTRENPVAVGLLILPSYYFLFFFLGL